MNNMRKELTEAEQDLETNLGQMLTKLASNPQGKSQLLRAIQSVPQNAGQTQQGQNQNTGAQGQQDNESESTEVPGQVQQALRNIDMQLEETGDEPDEDPTEPLNHLLHNARHQIARDDQMRNKDGSRLGDMIDLDIGDLNKREALEQLVADPRKTVKTAIVQWGDPRAWNVKVNAEGIASVEDKSKGTILDWVSEEDARSFINVARSINETSSLGESKTKRRTAMKMPKELKESIKAMNVEHDDFVNAVQRRLREARNGMGHNAYEQYKNKLIEHATNEPRKFVAFIGATDQRLTESYKGFRKLSKKLSESGSQEKKTQGKRKTNESRTQGQRKKTNESQKRTTAKKQGQRKTAAKK